MTANQLFDTVLRDLREKYQSSVIPVIEAGSEIGFKPGTTYNRVFRGTFPVPLVGNETKKSVSIYALAAFIAGCGEEGDEELSASLPKRKPGRPSKEEQMARARAERAEGSVK